MKFGQKLKLKKDWIYNKYLIFTKDEILYVAQYEHKYGMKLHHPKIADLLDFQFNWMDRDTKIEEYFEVIEDNLKNEKVEIMLNEIIEDIFKQNWTGKETLSSIENMRKQLYKNLKDQLNGYWSGHSAYSIMVYGGFLINKKRSEKGKLTALGERFIEDFERLGK